jgi:hypothetical protein
MQVVAHRGGRVEFFQENSFEIINDYFENYVGMKINGYDGIEFDIVEIDDGDFLIMHAEKESKRLTGLDINLTKMKREEIKNIKIQKFIEKSHFYEKDRIYDKEANFIFLDEIFDLYKKHKKEVILILDIKSISKSGCKKLKKMLEDYEISYENIKICGYGLPSVYYLSKYFPNVYKEWYPIIDAYSNFPYCIEKIYNYIMYYYLDDWTAISIALYDDDIVPEQMKFKRKNYKISYFGLTNKKKDEIIEDQLLNNKNDVSYICMDSDSI